MGDMDDVDSRAVTVLSICTGSGMLDVAVRIAMRDAITIGYGPNWPTPDAQNARDGTVRRAEATDNHHAVSLHHAAAQWQTPGVDSFRTRGGDRRDEAGLDRQAKTMWLMPSANEDAAGRPGANMQQMLAQQARAWATPNARDQKGGGHNLKGRTDKLDYQITTLSTHRDPEIPPGEISTPSSNPPSAPMTSRRQLNPVFVAWLMGWPTWWVRPSPSAQTPSGSPEMELYLSRLRSRLRILLDASA